MSIIVRTRKLLTNKLLSRKQMLVDVIHPEQANVSKEKLREELAKRYKAEPRNIICYGFRTQFGGGKSTGFALIYDSHQYLLKYEPKFRIRKLGVLPKRSQTRKARKEIKGKVKKNRGKEKGKLVQTRKDTPADHRKLKEDYLKKLVS